MEGTARIWFTPQQRAELWERWKNGQCVADIARALARRNKSGVYRILALNGATTARFGSIAMAGIRRRRPMKLCVVLIVLHRSGQTEVYALHSRP